MLQGFQEFEQFLNQLGRKGIQPSLDYVRQADQHLGSPHKGFRIIHIAGTNGKGSVCTFAAQMLSRCGYTVGLTLSPHVYRFHERVQIVKDGVCREVTNEELLSTHSILQAKIPTDLNLTYYEWSMLLSWQFFADQRVDFAVVETGLGGRWDASNLCHSQVSGIVSVDLDHQEYLGTSLPEILCEKLQIIKPGSDFLFGPKDGGLCQQAQQHCQAVGAHYHHQKNVSFDSAWQDIMPEGAELWPGYLKNNFHFALCLMALLQNQATIDWPKMGRKTPWQVPPARFEVINTDPFIVVDGAHNQAALTALKQHLDEVFGGEYDLCFGCTQNRDFLSLARGIRPQKGECFWMIFGEGRQAVSRSAAEQAACELGGGVQDLTSDFVAKMHHRRSERPLVVCGSFYLCGGFRQKG